MTPADNASALPAAIAPAWHIRSRQANGLYLLHISLYAGCLGFLWAIASSVDAGNGSTNLWNLYMRGWAWSFGAAALVPLLLGPLQRSVYEGRPEFFAVLLGALHLCALWCLHLPVGTAGWCAAALKSALVAVVVALLILRKLRFSVERGRQADQLMLGLAPVVAVAILVWFQGPRDWPPVLTGWAVVIALAVAAVCALGTWRQQPAKPSKLLDLAVLLGLAYLLFPWRPNVDIFHQNYFLGPIHDVMHGRYMFAPTRCQYGVTLIYAMAGFYKLTGFAVGHYSLTVLTAFLYLGLFWALWAFVLHRFGSRLLALAALAVALVTNRFGYWGDTWDPILYPSVGPWRFGLPLLTVLASWWRLRRGVKSRAIELFFVALSSIWAFEVFVYALAGYIAFCVLEAWTEKDGFAAGLGQAGARLAEALLWSAAANALLVGITYLGTGKILDYKTYWLFVGGYGAGHGFLQPDLHTPWFLVAFLSFLSCVAVFRQLLRGDRRRILALVGALAALGAAEYSYYIMRAHQSNLRYVGVPSIVAFFILLDLALAGRGLSRWIKASAVAAAIFTGGVAVLTAGGTVLNCMPRQSWTPIVNGNPGFERFFYLMHNPPVLNDRCKEAARLIAVHAPDAKEIAILLDGDQSTQAHLISGTIDPSGWSNVSEEEEIPYEVENPDPGLKAGDVVIMEQNPAIIGKLNLARTQALQRHFKLELLENGGAAVCAVRLAPLQ
jgi:hypothetical protein